MKEEVHKILHRDFLGAHRCSRRVIGTKQRKGQKYASQNTIGLNLSDLIPRLIKPVTKYGYGFLNKLLKLFSVVTYGIYHIDETIL